ncbi:hypothetical protein PFISCL1PPCAC_21065, partial [Pristionchus fissidentatus]
SSGEEEERDKEESYDEDYEESEKGEEDELPAKKIKIVKKKTKIPVSSGPKREMECPECKKYRSTHVEAMVAHLRKIHGTVPSAIHQTASASALERHLKVIHGITPSDIGLMFLCDCGNKSLSSAHVRTNKCKLLNFKIVHGKKYSGEKCIMCEKHSTTLSGFTCHLSKFHGMALTSCGFHLKCACGHSIHCDYEARIHRKMCDRHKFKVVKNKEE